MTTAIATRESALPARKGLTFEPQSLDEALHLFSLMIPTGLLPKHVKTPQHALVCYMLGRSFGLDLMTSLAHMYVVNGVPAMETDLLVALVRASAVCDHIEPVEYGPTKCVVSAQRKGSAKASLFTWTIEMARTASLLGKDPWKQWPQRMLMWRAFGDACAALFSDVTLGVLNHAEALDAADPVRPGIAPGIADAPPSEHVGEAPAPAKPVERVKARIAAGREASGIDPPMRNVTPPAEQAEPAEPAQRSQAQLVLDEARAVTPEPEPEPATPSVAAQAPDEEAVLAELELRRSELWNALLEACNGDSMLRTTLWNKIPKASKKAPKDVATFIRRAEETVERARIVRQLQEAKAKLNVLCGDPAAARKALEGRVMLPDLDRLHELPTERAKGILVAMITTIDERESPPPPLDEDEPGARG